MRTWGLFICILPLCMAAHGGYVSPESLLEDPTSDEWKALSRFDATLTRSQFEQRLNDVFDPTHGMSAFLVVADKSVQLYNSVDHSGPPLAEITFADSPDATKPVPVSFHPPGEIHRLQQISSDKPLSWLRVAIEPADIGGDWANMEDRSTRYPGYGLINEGELNLAVSKILAERLRQLGADVFVTRTDCTPVSTLQPEQLLPEAEVILSERPYLLPQAYFARSDGLSSTSPRRVRIAAEVLLTKTIEARAREEKLRENFQPDVTIVLQHNASERSIRARLSSINRNIFFVDGAYTTKEVTRDAQQRFRLLTKLFENVTPIETEVAVRIAKHFEEETGYPPVMYGNSPTTRMVEDGNYYVVARNIVLNRIHDGPVVVTEPYFMNQRTTLLRLLAGDYDGTKEIDGKQRISIYREYADNVVAGLLDSYGAPKETNDSKKAVFKPVPASQPSS